MSSLAMAAASIKRSESQTSLSTPNSHRGGTRGQRSFSRQGSVSSRQSSFGYGSTRGGRSVCKFYLEGRCNRGSSCQFRHPQPNHSSFAAKTNTQPICKFFLKGKCTRGSSCSFRHELNDDDTISVVTMGSGVPVQYAPSRQVCKYFANGYCSRGSTCNFLHESIQYNSVHVPTVSYGNVPAARSQPAYSTYSAPSVPKEKPTIEAIRARAARAKEAATKETPSLSSFAQQTKSNDDNEVTQVESRMEQVKIKEEPRPMTSLLTPTDSNRTPMKSNISKPDSSLQSDDDDQPISRDESKSTKESNALLTPTESAYHIYGNGSSDRNGDDSVSDVVTKEQSSNLNSATDVTSKEIPEISKPNDAPKVSSLLAAISSYGAKTASAFKQNLAPEVIQQEPASVKESPGTIAPKTQETCSVPVKGVSQESNSCLSAGVGVRKTQSSIGSSLSRAKITAPRPTALQSVSAVTNASETKKASSLQAASKLDENNAVFNETPALKASSLSQASSLLSAASRGGYSYVDSLSTSTKTKESVNPPTPTTKKVSSLQAASKSYNTSAIQSAKPTSSLSLASGQCTSNMSSEKQCAVKANPNSQGRSSLAAALHRTSSGEIITNNSLTQGNITPSLSDAVLNDSVKVPGSWSHALKATSLTTPSPMLQNLGSTQKTSTASTIGTDSVQQLIMDGSQKTTNIPDSSHLASTHEDFNHTIAKKPKSSLATMSAFSLHRASQSELHKTSNFNDQQKANRPTSLLAAASQRSKPEITTKPKSSLAAASGSLIAKTSSLQRRADADADDFNQSTAATSSLANAHVKEPIKSVKLPSSGGTIQLESGAPKSSLMARANVQEPAKPTYSSLLTASSKQTMVSSNVVQKSRSNGNDNRGQTKSTSKSTNLSHLAAASKMPEVSMSSLATHSSSAAQTQRCSPREATKEPSSSLPKSTNGRVSSLKATFESSSFGASNKSQLSWATRTRQSNLDKVQNPSTANGQVRSYASALNKASSLQGQDTPAPANSSNDSNTPVSKTNRNPDEEITALHGVSSGLEKLSPSKLTKPKRRWGDESDSDSD